MNVELTILAGPDRGRSAPVQPGQAIEVGRSKRCALVVSDMRMSSIHFCLEHTGPEFRVRDLQSRNGLYVNGKKVETATVRDGDQIRAGDSCFVLTPAEANGRPAIAAREAIAPPPPPPEVAESAPPGGPAVADPAVIGPPGGIDRETVEDMPKGGVFEREPLASGLTCYRPTAANKVRTVTLARALSRLKPLVLIAVPSKLKTAVAAEVEAEYLYDWLPPAARCQHSPVVFGIEASPFPGLDGPTILDKFWGKDAVSCLFSQVPLGELATHLRRLARGQELPDVEPPEGQASGFHYPRVFAQLLAVHPPAKARFLLDGIDAVLLEGPPPIPWQVFSEEGFANALIELGFQEESTDAPAS